MLFRKIPAVLAVAAAACLSVSAGEPVTLPIREVTEMPDFQTHRYPGKVVAIEQVSIVSEVNGKILKIDFENGSIVQAGQALYHIDPVKYEAAVKNAEAKIAEYKARMSYAKSKFDRNTQLSAAHAVSRDDLENSQSEMNAYQAALHAAEADLISAKQDLASCTITAPITGKIGTTQFTAGNYVTTGSGTLVTLVKTSPIRVRFSISNRDYLQMFGGRGQNIRENGKVMLTLSNGKPFAEDGVIEYVENAADEKTDSIRIYAKFPNADRILKPNGTVEITLQNKTGVKMPAIPLSAIMQDIKGTYVWTVGADNCVSKCYVQRGAVTQEYLLVSSGITAGTRIVADGTHKVRSGDAVQPEQTSK